MRKLVSVILLSLSFLSMSAQDDFGIWQYVSLTKGLGSGFGTLMRVEHRSRNNARDLDVAFVMPGVTYRPLSWLQVAFVYDFAIAYGNNTRNCLLPYVMVSHKAGNWTLSQREMLQYVFESKSGVLRSLSKIQYRIPDSKVSVFLAIESYSASRYRTDPTGENFLKDLSRSLGIQKSTNLIGTSFSLTPSSNLDVGYSYYFLGPDSAARHLLNIGYSIRL